ncbi:MAG: hypothetical protein WBA13_22980 [Microcoleaceae cyanobacterium]
MATDQGKLSQVILEATNPVHSLIPLKLPQFKPHANITDALGCAKIISSLPFCNKLLREADIQFS